MVFFIFIKKFLIICIICLNITLKIIEIIVERKAFINSLIKNSNNKKMLNFASLLSLN